MQYYSQPRIDDASERVELVTEEYRDEFGRPRTEDVFESIYTSFPMDRYAGIQETDPFHDFKSIIDFESRQKGAPTFSLGDGSYLSRAALLVPCAVGYSAGFIDHFFRGSVDIKWLRAPGSTWDLKLTNTSAEWIGDDAVIESVFTADAAYLNRSNSDDTAPTWPGRKSRATSPDFQDSHPVRASLFPTFRLPISNLETPSAASTAGRSSPVLSAARPMRSSDSYSAVGHTNFARRSAGFVLAVQNQGR